MSELILIFPDDMESGATKYINDEIDRRTVPGNLSAVPDKIVVTDSTHKKLKKELSKIMSSSYPMIKEMSFRGIKIIKKDEL